MKGLEDLTRFRVDVADHVATVTITSPPVNAQDGTFREEIIRVFDVLGSEIDIRAIVLIGEGKHFSAGAVLALVCDILVVAEDAYMAMTEVDYGLAGGVRHILRSFSPSDARLMIYTARRISGAELFRMNVASVCVPKDQIVAEATAIANQIAQKVPLAVVAAKRSFGLTEEMPLRDGYRYEQGQTAALADTEDTREALLAFKEKRKPVFVGR